MTRGRAVAIVGCLVIAAVVTAGGGATALPAAGNQSVGPMGAHLSSFMQANAARADGSVETGMWVAAVERAESNETRERLVRRQTGRLDRRLDRLQAQRAALLAARANGTIGPVAFRARMSRIVGRIAAVSAAINETEPRANASAIATLRERASRLAGEQVRAIARGLGGAGGEPGPPAWVNRGGNGNASEGRQGGPPAGGDRANRSGNGPPPNATNGSARGPPENAGNESGGGPPDDAGKGNGNGNESGDGTGNSGSGDGSGNDGGKSGNGGSGGDSSGSGNQGGGNGSDGGSGNGGNDNGGNGGNNGGGGNDGGSGNGGSGQGQGA